MGDFVLFDKTSKLGRGFIIAFVNRSQLLYFILFLPKFFQETYMIAGILLIGLLSQLNLFVLSRCLKNPAFQQGYEGFAQLLGKRKIRIITLIGIAVIFIKIGLVALGYSEIVHQFIFPAMQEQWMIFFIWLISMYISSQGMEKTLRFGVIAFLCTFWLIFLYVPYYISPWAELRDLYPLFPQENHSPWKSLFMIWSSFSGPEYLLLALPWIKPGKKMLKYLSIAIAITIFEYALLILACLFHYGKDYLGKAGFPIINMIRYLQSPVFERVEIIMISLQMFYYVFFISFLLLCLYGAFRITGNRQDDPTTRKGFFSVCLLVLIGLYIIHWFFWREGKELNGWSSLQLWAGALTYLLLPSFLLVVNTLKRRRSGI